MKIKDIGKLKKNKVEKSDKKPSNITVRETKNPELMKSTSNTNDNKTF